jgi:hypothetical protein
MIDIKQLQASARLELASEGNTEPTEDQVNTKAGEIYTRQTLAEARSAEIARNSRLDDDGLQAFCKKTQTAAGQGLFFDGKGLNLRAGNVKRDGKSEMVFRVYAKGYADKEEGFSPRFIEDELTGLASRLQSALDIVRGSIATLKGEGLVAKGGKLKAYDHTGGAHVNEEHENA